MWKSKARPYLRCKTICREALPPSLLELPRATGGLGMGKVQSSALRCGAHRGGAAARQSSFAATTRLTVVRPPPSCLIFPATNTLLSRPALWGKVAWAGVGSGNGHAQGIQAPVVTHAPTALASSGLMDWESPHRALETSVTCKYKYSAWCCPTLSWATSHSLLERGWVGGGRN